MTYVDNVVKILLNYETGTLLKIVWKNNLSGLYELDTFYDTDNGLEINEIGYREYHVALVKDYNNYSNLVEIGNEDNIPKYIEIAKTKETIWDSN